MIRLPASEETTISSRTAIEVFGSTFQNPILLAAGTAGFGREVAGLIDVGRLGGIITKAVSPEPREGNTPPRVAEFSGGMLNSVGLANPGLDRVVEREIPWLERNLGSARAVFNVVGSVFDDYVTVVTRLGAEDAVTAFELNVSCPNTDRGGEEFGADPSVLAELVRRCCEVTDKAVIPKLAPDLDGIAARVQAASEAGAAGFSVVNTIPGSTYGKSFEAGTDGLFKSRLGSGPGGVSGPPLLALGLSAVAKVSAETSLPIIGIGGIREPNDVVAYLEAGASLVAVGTAALADPRVPTELAEWWDRPG